jgi:hypothetical protein
MAHEKSHPSTERRGRRPLLNEQDYRFQAHPERFSKGRPKPPKLSEPAWINPPKKEIAT